MNKDEEINRASWPNPDKLGVPLNPHKTELHYIMDGVALWVPYRGRWTLLGRTRDERPSWLIEQSWAEYRGPCPSAEEFAAIKAERDQLRTAILDTEQHDAGLVPMRLRLLARKGTDHD
jgi:hypothetical protein